ncbi:MAG: carbamoyltransferase HypF, partial [candidate division Zixibacteria bacterium]|nr:carbamoyltransferase HypF [candidate division Zixibacteria bacterium]
FRTFPLPGGEKAIREPRRAALGLLFQIYGTELLRKLDLSITQAFTPQELEVLIGMLEKSINSPYTSSAGRLFDAVASIIGIRQKIKFEGQAAMELEYTLEGTDTNAFYRFRIDDKTNICIIDWEPIILDIITDVHNHLPTEIMAAKFHNAMAEIVIEMARRFGEKAVALSGGCFQNKYLTERIIQRLKGEGFLPYWHQRIPPNDGGIALGQAVAIAHMESRNK